MKFNIPFLNKQNYIVLKCYAANSYYSKYAPILLESKRNCPIPTKVDDSHMRKSFRTCFGRVDGLKKSATVPMTCTLNVEVKDDLHAHCTISEDNDKFFKVRFDHMRDPYYSIKDGMLSKIELPWLLEEDSGVSFVFARHIMNTTHMMMPSGVLNFKYQHALNIFNIIRKVPHKYTVDFRTPVISLFPMSEKPLHVECYYDANKYSELLDKSAIKSYSRGHMLKLNKLNLDNE